MRRLSRSVSLQAGTKENVIPDEAIIKLNVRTFDEGVRKRVLAAIKRIVNAEAEASGAPKPPEITALDRYSLVTTVLDAGPSREGLHLYAHSLRVHPGGVALLVINNDKTASQSLNLTTAAERYTLTAKNLIGPGCAIERE